VDVGDVVGTGSSVSTPSGGGSAFPVQNTRSS